MVAKAEPTSSVSVPCARPVDWDVHWGSHTVRVRAKVAYEAKRQGALIMNAEYNEMNGSEDWRSVDPQDCTVELTFRRGPQGVSYIIERVAHECGVDSHVIRAKKRSASITRARQIIAYVAREKTGCSWPEIGREMNVDHSSVMAAYERCKAVLGQKRKDTAPEDSMVKAVVQRIMEILP